MLDFQTNWMKDFSLKESSSSFNFSDIESFVYGPFTSRFWMLRKHILHLDKNKFLSDPPFFGWDCITLQIKNKWDVHLVIRNEDNMTKFLKLLIHKMETIDGHRGTSTQYQKNQYEKISRKLRKSGEEIDEMREDTIKKQIAQETMRQVLKKYVLSRVR